MDPLSLQRSDTATRQDIHREIQRERAGMEKIQGPEVDGSAGEIGTTGSQRHDRTPIENSGGFHAEFVSRFGVPPGAPGSNRLPSIRKIKIPDPPNPLWLPDFPLTGAIFR